MASDPSTPRETTNEESSESAPDDDSAAMPIQQNETPPPPPRRIPFLIDPRHLFANRVISPDQLIQSSASASNSAPPPSSPSLNSAPIPVVSSSAAAVPGPAPRPKQLRGPRGPYNKKPKNGAGPVYNITNNLNFHPNMDVEKIAAVVRALQEPPKS